jgi:hypothetical protein
VVTLVVEGELDRAVARKLARSVGLELSPELVASKQQLLRQLSGYNNAARYGPWLVLVDFDGDFPCVLNARNMWLPNPTPMMNLRIVVHAIESWLIADREALAQFLHVPVNTLPLDPESVERPKSILLQAIGRSRVRRIREDMLPRGPASGSVGPGYNLRLIEFCEDHWDIAHSEERSESLRRALRVMERLAVVQIL